MDEHMAKEKHNWTFKELQNNQKMKSTNIRQKEQKIKIKNNTRSANHKYKIIQKINTQLSAMNIDNEEIKKNIKNKKALKSLNHQQKIIPKINPKHPAVEKE